MNLLDLMIKIGLENEASSALDKVAGDAKSVATSIGSGLATAAKVGAAGIAAAAGAVTALTTASVKNYAEYEQLVGGIDTLFAASSAKVQEVAANAFFTAGMSANDYMDTVTSFSASLLQGLGGDTDKAAEIANRAITDMSDNANKMGTSMEAIQNAYQGFAKQNYTMLDNLKLGYGGTASEMARLINDSGVLGSQMTVTAKTVNDVSFDKIIEAIGVVQDKMGITGTTAAEAASTIQGSISSMQSAWQNLLTGISDENADLGALTGNLIESVATVADNLVPRIGQALSGVAEAFQKLTGIDISVFTGVLQGVVSGTVETVGQLTAAFQSDGIAGAIDVLLGRLTELTGIDLSGFTGVLQGAVSGVAETFGQLTAAFQSDGITGVVDTLVSQLAALTGIDLSGLTSALAGMLGAIDGASIRAASEAVGALLAPFRDSLGPVITAVADAYGGFIGTLLDAGIGKAAGGIAAALSGLFGAFASRLPGVIEAVGGALNGLFGFLLSLGTGPLATIAEAVINLLSPFVAGAADIILSVAGALSTLFAYADEKLTEPLQALADAIADLFAPLTDGLDDIISGVAQALGDFAVLIGKRVIDDFKKFAEILQKIAEYLEPMVSYFVNTAQSIVDFVKVLFDSKKDINDVMYALGQLFADLVHNAIGYWQDLLTFVQGIPEKLLGFFQGLPGRFAEIGRNIVEGIKNGILGAWEGLKSFVSGLWDGLFDSSKKDNEINSPSKRYAKIGAYLAQGVALGWGETFGGVENTVSASYDRLARVGASVGTVGFADSGVGRSSKALADTVLQTSYGGGNETQTIHLVLDGKVLASLLYDPLRGVVKQKGGAALA